MASSGSGMSRSGTVFRGACSQGDFAPAGFLLVELTGGRGFAPRKCPSLGHRRHPGKKPSWWECPQPPGLALRPPAGTTVRRVAPLSGRRGFEGIGARQPHIRANISVLLFRIKGALTSITTFGSSSVTQPVPGCYINLCSPAPIEKSLCLAVLRVVGTQVSASLLREPAGVTISSSVLEQSPRQEAAGGKRSELVFRADPRGDMSAAAVSEQQGLSPPRHAT